MSAATGREQAKPDIELGFLLPPLSAVALGSTVVHAAPIVETEFWWGTHRYPRLTSLCGVRGWGEGTGPVTCKRCLAAMARLGVAT